MYLEISSLHPLGILCYLFSPEISLLAAHLGSTSTLHDRIAFHWTNVHWIQLIKTFFLLASKSDADLALHGPPADEGKRDTVPVPLAP